MIKESKLGEKQSSPKKKKENKSSTAKNAERKLKTEKNASDLPPEDSSSGSAVESSEEMELVTQLGTFSTSDLGGHHCNVKSKSKKKASSPGARKGNESKSKKHPGIKSKGR